MERLGRVSASSERQTCGEGIYETLPPQETVNKQQDNENYTTQKSRRTQRHSTNNRTAEGTPAKGRAGLLPSFLAGGGD